MRPGQFNVGPCHSLNQWVSDLLIPASSEHRRAVVDTSVLSDWLIRQRQRQRHWERFRDSVTNWETLFMTLRIRDWQSESDLESIRNICDILFERMKIENYFDICKCCDVVLLLSLFLSVSLWLSKLGCCHMKRAVLGFKRLQCPTSSQRATNQLFSLNPHSNVLPAIQCIWNSHKLFVVSPPLPLGKSPIVWVMWTEKGIWKYKCLNLSRCIWQVCFLWSHMYIVYQDSDCLWMKASKGLCHWHSVNDVDTVAFNIISQFFSSLQSGLHRRQSGGCDID